MFSSGRQSQCLEPGEQSVGSEWCWLGPVTALSPLNTQTQTYRSQKDVLLLNTTPVSPVSTQHAQTRCQAPQILIFTVNVSSLLDL